MFLMTLKAEIASGPNPHMPSWLCPAEGFREGARAVALRTLLLPALRDSLAGWTLWLPRPPKSWFLVSLGMPQGKLVYLPSSPFPPFSA